ncbi:uncharacterized protein A4U43_C04F4290 [Asparagus officinalis]|uniref:Pentacotripeptide-repeat region of PRORP domain-containing protein n=1 Tax=Asparagus officinalis TaxID=4686 RepID=A0A5P1F3M4_ASPOF|nr:pentatricopeptide repeat-containing protein At2g17525, mitochondrial [Asparagus officinalis]ONK71060.1 uncharacterized protein A4U43_C04F4290 [Asparagus officinalis]
MPKFSKSLSKIKSLSSSSPSTPAHDQIPHLALRPKPPSSKPPQTLRWASKPSPPTLGPQILSLISSNNLQEAHRLLLSSPHPPPEPALLPLIRAFGRAHRPDAAIRLLGLFPPQNPPSLRVLNSILNVLVEEDIDLARKFFRKGMSVRDEHTFGILMKGLCGANRIQEAFKLLKLMKSSASLKPNSVIYNTLIHGLCRNGGVGRGRSLMGEMDEVSDVTFHILISAYCKEDNLVQALVMLEKCFDSGFVPDKITVTKVVDVLCGHGRAMEAVELLERVESKGGVVDVVSYNSLVKGFCRMEKPEVGRRVLKEMERKGCLANVHTYNALISGFCDSGKVDSGMDLFREMGMVGVSPDFETFDLLIRGFCLEGRVEDGLRILDMMEETRGYESRVSPYNSLLYGFYKENRLEEGYEFLKKMESLFPRVVGRSLRILGFCEEGKIGEGKIIFDQMVNEGDIPSVFVYVSLIVGLSIGGNVREAFGLMNEMVERGYFPMVSTFNALIHGFCEEGNFRSSLKLLDEMVSRRCSPTTESYNPLICSLCKQGDEGRAYNFLVQMVERGIVPDSFTWSCFLVNERFEMKLESTTRAMDALCNNYTDD